MVFTTHQQSHMTTKLWGGRFTENAAAWVDAFGASITFDQEMAAEDIEGSIAHATMLGRQGIISETDAAQIVAGLKALQQELAAGELGFDVQHEDIHMNIEALLTAVAPVARRNYTLPVHATIKSPLIFIYG